MVTANGILSVTVVNEYGVYHPMPPTFLSYMFYTSYMLLPWIIKP